MDATKYKLLEDTDEIEVVILNEEESEEIPHQKSKVEQLRQFKNKQQPIYDRRIKQQAEEGIKKYLSKGIYDDRKMLQTDINAIKNYIKDRIKKNPNNTFFSFKLDITRYHWIKGCDKLYKIYDKYKIYDSYLSQNKIFQNYYWKTVDNARVTLGMGLAQSMGIPIWQKTPVYSKKSQEHKYKPDCGICVKYDKVAKANKLHVWF